MSKFVTNGLEDQIVHVCAELTFGVIDGNVVLSFRTVDTGGGKRIVSSLILKEEQ